MKAGIIHFITRWFTFGLVLRNVLAQCNFQPPFNNSVWQDNTKGTLTFSTQYMSGWTFRPFFQTVNQWQCVNSTAPDFLVMRTQTTFRYTRTTGAGVYVYGYLCLQLTNVTDTSYIYYQQQVQINDIGGERMKLSPLGTLNSADVCSDTVNVPPSEYHVIIKSGSEEASAVTCPNSLLFTSDYTYQYNDTSSQICDTTADMMDVCSNSSQIVFNYTTCSQQIAYSAGGLLLCVANINSGGYDYVTLLNMDTALTTATSKFSCMSTDGSSASVAISNCTATQTPTVVPVNPDGTTVTGHLLIFTNKYSSCGSTETVEPGGLTGGQVAAIVVCILLFFFFLCLCVCLVGCLCTVCCIVLDDLASDSEKVKSPVSLPDIEAQLQHLKLNQGNYMNGGPLDDKKKPVIVNLHHNDRGKHVLPPFSDRKGKTPREGKVTKIVDDDKIKKTSQVVKRDIGNEHINDNKIVKQKSVIIKDNEAEITPGRSPRKVDVTGQVDKKAGDSPRKIDKVERQIQSKLEHSPRKTGHKEPSPRKVKNQRAHIFIEPLKRRRSAEPVTVYKVCKEQRDTGSLQSAERSKRGAYKPADNFDQTAIKNKRQEFYTVRRQLPTLRNLHKCLKKT